MKILKRSNENQVILKWLQSELYRMKAHLQSEELELINNSNLKSDIDNQARKKLLFHRYGRGAILEKIPTISEWFETEIEEIDVKKLYILPVFDWFLDTGGTFKFIDVIDNLAPNRGYEFNNQISQKILHYKKIQEMLEKPLTDLDGVVIITSSIADGLYTVIDGTHRTSALIKKKELVGLKTYTGVSRNLSNCIVN